MLLVYFFLLVLCDRLNAEADYEDSQASKELKTVKIETETESALENLFVNETYFATMKNLNCDDITEYAKNCSVKAAAYYNNSIKTPPLPERLENWCDSIKSMVACATDWNQDCKDVTESKFNEDSITGHLHIYKNVCLDDNFLTQYENLTECIENTALDWEACYDYFQKHTFVHKIGSEHWTHYKTHFSLCCARAKFRRCSLDAVINVCKKHEVFAIQKYAVVISEGDIFQDCDHNMMYDNCPGGDPRPKSFVVKKLQQTVTSTSAGVSIWINYCFLFVIMLVYLNL